MRAVEPTSDGTVERAGAVLHYDVYEHEHGPTAAAHHHHH